LGIRSSSLNIIHKHEDVRSSSVATLVNTKEKIKVRRIGAFALRIRIRASPSSIVKLEGIIERRI